MLLLLCMCFSQVSTCPLLAGQTMLRGSLLDGLHGEILVQHAAWLADEKLAKHLTLFIDGWSNARMESIYAICVMFPDRRAILLDALDLSSLTHSAENIAGALQTLFVCILKVTMPVKNVSTHACRDCYQDQEPIWAQEVHWSCYRQCPEHGEYAHNSGEHLPAHYRVQVLRQLSKHLSLCQCQSQTVLLYAGA